MEHRVAELIDSGAFDGLILERPFDMTSITGLNEAGYGDHERQFTLDQVVRFAAKAYRHFGGISYQLPPPVGFEEVLAFASDPTRQDQYLVWGHEEAVAQLAHTYMVGNGADYETFLKFEEQGVINGKDF
ncbi:MAG TPA: hypothetical protein VN778_03195 [Verrucomicrobiae bacterium]|nr:hypothetical protein [Verrucomicrobiae bacterium]